ncbi:MAG: energy transducer TonB family protein [Acidithiobacillus sp.]
MRTYECSYPLLPGSVPEVQEGSLRTGAADGTTTISFRLTPSGHLLSAQVAQSSGIGAINRAALKTVEDTSFPPFTKKMPKHPMTFDVSVHLSAHSG